MLEWISIYWFSRAGPAASCRIYYEMTRGGIAPDVYGNTTWTSVPLGVFYFPREPIRFPQSYVVMYGSILLT